jgi:hypothetical protein
MEDSPEKGKGIMVAREIEMRAHKKATVVTIHQAKTNLSRLIQKAAGGEEVIISRGSKPVARLSRLAR